MLTQDEIRYFEALHARQHETVTPRRVRVTFTDGDGPTEGNCHGNADRWVSEHPDFQPVRGWVIDGHMPGTEYVHYVAHSLVQGLEGELWDTTNLAVDVRLLRHEGSEEEFAALERRFKWIDWPPLCYPLTD